MPGTKPITQSKFVEWLNDDWLPKAHLRLNVWLYRSHTSHHFFFVFGHVLFFIILFFLLAYNSFTWLCSFLLYNEVNELYVHVHPSAPLTPSHPSGSSRSAELSRLSCSAVSHRLSLLHTVACTLSLPVSLLLPSPTVSPSPFSTSASLFLPCK